MFLFKLKFKEYEYLIWKIHLMLYINTKGNTSSTKLIFLLLISMNKYFLVTNKKWQIFSGNNFEIFS